MLSKVSILIPVYNTEKYLERCLLSVVSQTYNNIQVVIVNDGSTDSSLKICERFVNEYSFIELYSQSNQGVATTRNNLLKKIEGKYFLFVDSDDWIESDMIESLVSVIETQNTDMAVCGSIVERENQNSTVIKNLTPVENLDRNNAIKLFLYHERLNGSLWNKLISTELIKGVYFDSSVSYGEDALFIWENLKKVKSIAIIKSQLYHYQVNSQSISHQKFGPKKLSGHKVWKRIAEDTARGWKQFETLAKANYAVSDFWLLVFAAIDNYPHDDNIRLFRRNLKDRIGSIYKLHLLSSPKLIMAGCFILNYRLATIILRSTRRFFNIN